MRRSYLRLYPDHPRGEIKAHCVGSFVKDGEAFDVIRPGYDIQGRRKIQWTQVVHGGVPIFEHRLTCDIVEVMERFDRLWDKHIGDDADIRVAALAATKKTRLQRFRDGVTGEPPAPALTRDGRPDGERKKR
jgi:hypothetical protein